MTLTPFFVTLSRSTAEFVGKGVHKRQYTKNVERSKQKEKSTTTFGCWWLRWARRIEHLPSFGYHQNENAASEKYC